MSIKCTTTDKKPVNIDFPKLMCAKGAAYGQRLIILAHGYADELMRNLCGTVIQSGHDYYIGQYRTDWSAMSFTNYHGAVTLENEQP